MKLDNAKIRTIPQKSEENLLKKNINPIATSVFNEGKKGEFYYFSINQLIPYEKQPRIFFDEDKIDQLAQTIKEHGIRQPLTVIKSLLIPGKYEIVSGERRYKAAIKAGIEKIPCIVIDDYEKASELAIIENIQREDLHPIELARALNHLLSKSEYNDQSKLSKKLAMAKSVISETLKLLSLPESVAESLVKNNIKSRDILRKISAVESEEKQKKIVLDLLSNPLEKEKSNKIGKNSLTSQSVLRVGLYDGSLSIQKSALKRLSVPQREELKKILLKLVSEL